MVDIEAKKFFLSVLEDLRSKCNSNSIYDYIKASGLIRQFLIDDTPLIDIINREYKEKIVYQVTKRRDLSPRKYTDEDGLTYETVISVTFINPTEGSQVEILNRDQFLKYPIITLEGREITVLEILKLTANIKGGIHLGSPKTIDERIINIGNSTINYTGGITGGAYSVHEIGKIVLKSLKTLEEKVKADIEGSK